MKLIILILSALLICGSMIAPESVQAQAVSKEAAFAAVDGMVSAGLLRLDAPGGRAYVDPEAWAAFNAKAKEGLASAVAFYISPNKSSGRNLRRPERQEIGALGNRVRIHGLLKSGKQAKELKPDVQKHVPP